MLKKMKNNKKGFTLVELIVVLVILAILAALLIPALTGYIDKAKEKSVVAETRQVVMAAQTLVDEKYGTKDLGDSTAIAIGTDVSVDEILKLAELTGKGTIDTATNGATVVTGGKVEKLTYTNTQAKKKCVYDASKAGTSGAYTVTDVE